MVEDGNEEINHHQIECHVQVCVIDVESPFDVHLLMLFHVLLSMITDDDGEYFSPNTFHNDRETTK